jgi:hypothetical protein
MTLEDTLQTTGNYAHLFSGNAKPDQPYGLDPRVVEFVKSGYQAGATAF